MADKEIFLNSGGHKVDLPKSTFDKSFTNHLTGKLGYLYPCYVEEAVPGSSYVIRPDMAFDLMPMAMPLQSRMRVHVSFFNVPFRILMKSYKDFFSRVGEHVMPYISRDENWVTPGSLADYMGLPTAQLSNVSRAASLELVRRGYINFSQIQYDINEPLAEDVYLGTTPTYSLDDLLSFPSTSPLISVVSVPLLHTFSADTFSVDVVTPIVPSALSLYLYMLVSSRGTGQYAVYQLVGLGTNGAFNSGNTSGSYTRSALSNFTPFNVSTGDSSSTVRGYHYTLSLTGNSIRSLNSFISNPDYEVRLMLGYTPTYQNIFGYGSSLVPSLSRLYELYHVVSSFNKDDTSEGGILPSLGFSIPGSILNYISYEAYMDSVEVDRNYFSSVEGAAPVLPINALPFRAYEFIYNKFFRNLQVDKFYKNGEVSYNEYITNDGDGADGTTPVELKHVPYEYDIFTTALLSPQEGYAPLVGVTTNDAEGIGKLTMVPLVDGQPDVSQQYDIGVAFNPQTGALTGISNYDEVANKTSVVRLREAIDFGISINDLRNVSAFQRLKEKMMKAGFEYQPLMEEFFGTTPPIGEEFPEYLGGMTREIRIGKIQNTALSSEHALGEYAGVGGVFGSGKTIKVYCKEPSYIIGVLWFSVTPTYSQMLPKHFLKSHPLDYFNPTFNAIGPQPIYKHEIAPLQLDQEELMDVFGYQRPWYDYTMRVDECHGEFRTSMRDYLLQRLFLQAPELTANFVNIHSDELTDIFTYVKDTDKFFGFVSFDVKCKSPVARVSVPRIIG